MNTTDPWIAFFVLLAVAANAATLGLWALAGASRVSDDAARRFEDVRDSLGRSGLAIGALVAGTAMVGSLYLSEVADFVPCTFCWYQRIAIYPMAVLLVIAAARRDWSVRPYVITLGVIGVAISTYHYVEQHFPDLSGSACDPNNPCFVRWVWELHYISIPWMALSTSLLVVTVLAAARPATEGDSEAEAVAWDDEPHFEEVR